MYSPVAISRSSRPRQRLIADEFGLVQGVERLAIALSYESPFEPIEAPVPASVSRLV